MRVLTLATLAALLSGCLGGAATFSAAPEPWVAANRLPIRAPVTSGLHYQKVVGAVTFPTATRAETAQWQRLKPVTAESCQWSINFQSVSAAIDSSGYHDAYQKALRASGGDALTEVVADTRIMNVLMIYWQVCTVLHGTAVKRLPDGVPPSPQVQPGDPEVMPPPPLPPPLPEGSPTL